MKYLKNRMIFLLLSLAIISKGQQTNVSSNLKDFEGIWQFKPPLWSNDTSFTAIDIFNKNIRFEIFLWHYPSELSTKERVTGFAPQNKEIQRLSDLVDVGTRMYFYTPNPKAPNDSIHHFQEASPSCLARYNGVVDEESEPPQEGEPDYFTFNFNGRENEFHQRIQHLPNRIIVALCQNKVEKAKVEAFINIKYGLIKNKSIIHSSPDRPTKMYLIQNDSVEIVEQRDDWLKIKFYPEKNGEWTGKIIEGWIKRSDVE
ncbi:MAG: hypothetical protein ACK4R6_14540 [Spirosomataceae bacterium]